MIWREPALTNSLVVTSAPIESCQSAPDLACSTIPLAVPLVEVISPCPTGFGRRHRQREGLDTLRYYREYGVIDHDADLHKADIRLGGSSIEGNFVNIDKPTFVEQRSECLAKALG